MIGRWLLIAAATLAGTLVADAAGLPSSSMVVALVVGLTYAVRSSVPLDPPGPVHVAAQAVTGAAIGTYVSRDTIAGLGGAWLPVLVIVTATLVLTFAAGLVLARLAPSLSPATATFGMIAGGASGIVTIAGDLGADDRMVAVMQYLRVLLILLVTPLLAAALFSPGTEATAYAGIPRVSTAEGLAFLAVACPAGLVLARALRFTAPSFFGPMAAGAALSVAGFAYAGAMPNLVPYLAFAVIGLKVGLDFTPAVLRQARQVLPAVLAVMVAMLVACGLLGLIMAPLAGVPALDGYLATTPGVLQVVLATAIGMKANTTFILSAQVVRLLIMLLAAPVVARRLIPPGGGEPARAPA